MKLNTKNTVLIGFAFLSISAFWQMYDSLVPLILSKTFDIGETYSGIIMAADNILALFLLPIFGGISDKCQSRMGRRKPFILRGTLVACALMIGLPILDNSYFYSPAPYKTLLFIVLLGLLLITMGTYRSPAVALMPDVTPKPLRSKGNAIINLMGAVGGIIYLVVTSVLYSKSRVGDLEHIDYLPIFLVVAGIMLVSLFIIMFFVDEPRLRAAQIKYENEHPEEQLTVTDTKTSKSVMPKDVRRSLIFILLSVAFWFIGYNAVTTWFTTYATEVWGMATGGATLCLTIATAGAIVSYLPIGIIASRLGRKKVIIFGVILLCASFAAAFLYTLFANEFSPILYGLFSLVGVAWASINVNSLPMVVEMCSEKDVGKFTGLYYTFSMSAQTVAPVLSGALYQYVSPKALFACAAIFVAFAFITMIFVKHGDNKIESKTGLEAFDIDD